MFSENQFVVQALVDKDMVALKEVPFQYFQGKRILNVPLDCPFQRAGAI